MSYNKNLPPIRQLLSLANDVQYPSSRKDIDDVAADWGFEDSMIDFLDLFPPDEIFESKVDFMTRCEGLEMLINQAQDMPKEILRSPQD